MSGTLRGVVDINSALANEYQNGGDLFKVLFDAFEAHPGTTRIALQHGSGGTGDGAGTGRWDSGAGSFANNAFAVWRMNTNGGRTWPWYFTLHSQCAGGNSATWGAAPGDPLASEQSTASSTGYVGFQAAIGIGGDENPWNGSTANDGTDSRAGSAALPLGGDGSAAVWRTPVGGTNLMVFPRSNNPGGAYDTGKEDMCVLMNGAAGSQIRSHLIMDDDNLCLYWDYGDAGTSNQTWMFMGVFDPHPGISAYDRPFVQWRSNTSISEAAATERSGGIAVPDSTELNSVMRVEFNARKFHDAANTPNAVFVPPEYDLTPFDILMADGARKGFAGTTQDVFQVCYGVPRNSSNAAKTFGILGNNTVDSLKAAFKWTGVLEPGATSTREGVTF